MDIVERLRRINAFLHVTEDEPEYDYKLSYEAADEIERLQKAIKIQFNAAQVLHQAETTELNGLRKTAQEAYMAVSTLDSEREVNKILTDEVERLREALNADNQTIRLHLGEMTQQEMRTVKAAFAWVLSRAALKEGE
jgi:hypothetical protein